MTTDPGDLVLDPTCGSGTTAYVAEQWGRRWITIDTSRIALNIAKTRLMTAVFPYYHLYSDVSVEKEFKDGKIKKKLTPLAWVADTEGGVVATGNVRQGFVYDEVPHITLKSLANDELPDHELLYDKPMVEKNKMRVAGPFTVETLQSYEPLSMATFATEANSNADLQQFEQNVRTYLETAGVLNGDKKEKAVFSRTERQNDPHLHLAGFYMTPEGERKAYIHIGPKYNLVAKKSVSEAVKACQRRGDADWLIILGFGFDSAIIGDSETTNQGSFVVTRTRMHDDLLQAGLRKKDKKAGAFITIGEPDVAKHRKGDTVQIEIRGIDIFNPMKNDVDGRDLSDVAYWMLDDDYDGSNFVVKQIFFCGSDTKDEFKDWEKALEQTKKKLEKTLKIEIDHAAFEQLYGYKSLPFKAMKGQRVAVRVISQFGEETMRVLYV